MRPVTLLLALVPLLGLGELALHRYFAGRAPGFGAYAALAPELVKLKKPGIPVVVAPRWAEPLVRQAAPEAFPIAELTRPDDTALARFLEVSLLGERAPELAGLGVLETWQRGPFTIRLHENPKFELVRFDFVTAVDTEQVEVFTGRGEERTQCKLAVRPRTTTGGLHGPVTRPRKRFECAGGAVVGVTLSEDERYQGHRCILVEPVETGDVWLRFSSVPESPRLVGFVGYSAFLARNFEGVSVDLTVSEAEQKLSTQQVRASDGWSRFELARSAPHGAVELRVHRRQPQPADFCFALEAR